MCDKEKKRWYHNGSYDLVLSYFYTTHHPKKKKTIRYEDTHILERNIEQTEHIHFYFMGGHMYIRGWDSCYTYIGNIEMKYLCNVF